MELKNININKHSSIRIAGEKILYFDPFKIENESHDADYIFITHEHYDHFDPSSINKIKKDDSIIIAPETMKKKLLKELKINEDNCVFAKPNDTYELNTINVVTIPAYNTLKPFHMKSSKWLGYIVKMDDIKYYISGDTDANKEVMNVKCDVALIPIGGFYTMDKKQAAELIINMKPKAVIPTHYGDIVGSKEDGIQFKELVNASNDNIQVEVVL